MHLKGGGGHNAQNISQIKEDTIMYYWVLLGNIGYYWVQLGTFGFWILLGTFGYYWVLFGAIGSQLVFKN